jgi:hypothetical protein
MKKWLIILTSLLVLLSVAAIPLPILASGNSSGSDSIVRPALRGGLAIVAPRFALAGSDITLTVFSRRDQTPVQSAEIWCINRNNVPDFKEAIRSLRQKWQGELTELNAKKIGETDSQGKLSVPAEGPGKYLLIAYKQGYVPDFSVLTVRTVLVASGPESAIIGDNVTFTVTDKGTGEIAADVELWSVARENVPAFKAAIREETLNHKGDLENADWTAVLKDKAELLGTTDENGELDCSFDEEGKYLLAAVLEGKIAGFCRIVIESP